MQLGKKKFNNNSKRGLQYLFENGLLANTSEAVAKFLYECDGLKKSTVGDFLGEKDAFNLEVLGCYVRYHNFKGMRYVDIFFSSFIFLVPGWLMHCGISYGVLDFNIMKQPFL